MSLHRETSQLVAGAISGFVATGVTAPLDLVKTVLQNSSAGQQSSRTFSILTELARQEGWSACFKGLSPSLCGIALQWAVYFPIYDNFKMNIGRRVESPIGASVLSAMGAGAFATVVTNPFWLVKVRMQAYSKSLYPSMWSCARMVYRHEGPSGFFKGLPASLLGILHVGVQFPLYEMLKTARSETQISPVDIVTASAVSKGVASVCTYPLEVVRTRLQCQRTVAGADVYYKGMLDVCKKISSEEGLKAFYRGSGANMIRTIPASVITFGVYELLSKQYS